jgi:hypothetical protein
MRILFTEENSRLAALLHGDTNDAHKNKRFGKIIAPGLMQLQGFVARHGWDAGKLIEVSLEKALVVPNPNAGYSFIEKGKSYILGDDFQTYARANIYDSRFPEFDEGLVDFYNYSLTKEQATMSQLKDWRNYKKVPVNMVSKIIPETDAFSLDRVSMIGVSVNAMVKTLADNPLYLPDVFFSEVRENGENAVLEEKLCLYMGECDKDKGIEKTEEQQFFQLGVYEPRYDPNNKRRIIATVSESRGIFCLEIYLKKMKVEALKRVLEKD